MGFYSFSFISLLFHVGSYNIVEKQKHSKESQSESKINHFITHYNERPGSILCISQANQ